MESLQQLWTMVCDIIKQNISMVAFNTWVAAIVPVTLDGDRLNLSVHTQFQKSIIEANYTRMIADAAEELLGFPISVVFFAEKSADGAGLGESQDSKYTFENFIVSDSNRFAHAAAQAVAKNPGKSYNPLFIYGNSGLGKTHLLTAIKNGITSKFPEYTIVYVQGEDFINDFIESLTHNTQSDFRKKYRFCDVLIVDDIQFIANKISVQEEFFHTFDALHRSGKQIVLSSDRAPKNILSLDSRLRTRFETGLADISPPSYEMRIAILKARAIEEKLDISDDVVGFIASKVTVNIRQLLAVINKLSAKKYMNSVEPTMQVAQETCRDIINDSSSPAITVDLIKDEVSRVYQISVEDIVSQKQNAQTALVRQIAIYVTRELTPLSLKEIGDVFGNRHYATIHYSIEQISKEIKRNPRMRETIEDIIKNIKSKE